MLFVFVILPHDRRRPVHFAVTEHPTADWAARQLLEAFPWNSAPHYLLRDRDGSFDYYERSRTHLSLDKDTPITRPIQHVGVGPIVEIPEVGGLHHRYERIAA